MLWKGLEIRLTRWTSYVCGVDLLTKVGWLLHVI